MPQVEKDFEELLRLFNKHKVRYCIVGAFAVAFHALPRYTKDLDLLVEPSRENGEKIIRALIDFGFASLKLSADDFAKKGRFIQLGFEPVRIDLITSVEGVKFGQVWDGKKLGKFGQSKTYFIGLKELIKNKKASHRLQDLADLEVLKKAKKTR